MDTKTRIINPITPVDWSFKNSSAIASNRQVFVGRQITTSEGHPVSLLTKDTGGDIGGDFKTQKAEMLGLPVYASLLYNPDKPDTYWWRGDILATEPPAIFKLEEKMPSNLDIYAANPDVHLLDERGTTAISRVIPTNPVFNAASAIGELREGLPAIPGKSALPGQTNPKNIAGEYLNWEFGIKPTIAEVTKFREASAIAEKHMQQLYRDSGRLVRRKYSFPPTEDVVTTTKADTYCWPTGTIYTHSRGTLTTTTRTKTEFWFSGGFTYHMPRQEGFHRKMDEMREVYGITPDAAALWQLMPWSWAIDWVSNAGDLIQNLTAFSQDGLVLRYGYIMCKTTHTVQNTWNGSLRKNGVLTPTTLKTDWRFTTKERRKATPFGFGVNTSAFSTRQNAIIAALGISRFSKTK